MVATLVDPWRPAPGPAAPAAGGSRPLRALGVAVVGAAGVAASLWGHGAGGRRGALVLVALAAVVGAVATAPRSRSSHLAVLVGAAGLAAAGSVPDVGRAPVAVVVAASLVGAAAIAGWRPVGAPGSPAGLAVPVLAVGQVLAWRGVGLGVVLGLVVLGALVVAVSWRWPSSVAAPEAALGRAAAAVGRAAVALVLFAAAVPAVYLPGALVRLATRLRPGGAERAGSWQLPSTVASQRRDARLPFASPPRPVAVRRHLVAAAVVALVVVAVVVVDPGRPRTASPPSPSTPAAGPATPDGPGTTAPADEGSIADRLDRVPFADRPAMAGLPYASDLQAETYDVRLVEDPVTGYALGDRDGDLVNVVDGSRVTAEPDCPGCPTATGWLVGGSLVFGIGQRDGGTIASALVAAAAERGVALELANLGVPGWTLAQEQAAVAARIAEEGPPDLVVFLDGWNDVVATEMDVLVDGSVPEGPAALDPEKVDALLEGDLAGVAFDPEAVGEAAAVRYAETAAPVDRQLRSEGIEVARYFQPDASSSPVQRRGVEDLGVLPDGFYEAVALDAVLGAAAAALVDDGVVDLRASLDGLDRPVFLDTSHVNERGAAAIAAALLADLGPTLERLADGP